MIGSPENNFNTMQNQQPRNQMLGNALRNTSNYRQPNPAQPSMLPASQYGNPTPQMSNMQMPQSNASFNMQPPVPNMNQSSQGPMGMLSPTQMDAQKAAYQSGMQAPVQGVDVAQASNITPAMTQGIQNKLTGMSGSANQSIGQNRFGVGLAKPMPQMKSGL